MSTTEKASDAKNDKPSDEKKEKASDDMFDPQSSIREQCKIFNCPKYVTRLQECNERVRGKKETKESCFEEVIDMMHCVDHCTSHSLFSKLK